ncbi:MAG: TlpA family protein disulfide reductase, partial [Thermoflexales bacterium]|nr:TlpA family protein disulfide reductase [Thermoflexales bacterium]
SAALAVALVAVVFAVALNLASQQGARPKAGSPAPDFELALFEGYRAGFPERLRLSDLRGRVVVINFWASWCKECYNEAAALERVWREYRDRGVVFIGVDYLDTEAPALAYLKQFDITYPNGLDVQQRIANAYRITGVPETFFVDRQGRVADVVVAAVTEADLRRRIDALLQN